MNAPYPMIIKAFGVALATYIFVTIMGMPRGLLAGAALAMIILP